MSEQNYSSYASGEERRPRSRNGSGQRSGDGPRRPKKGRGRGGLALRVIGTLLLIAVTTGAILCCFGAVYVRTVILPKASLELGDVTLRLSDTAGLRASEDTVEAIGVERARSRLRAAALALIVLDGSAPLSQEDRELLENLRDAPAIAIINKADLPLKMTPDEVRALCPYTVVLSAQEGKGLDELTAAVRELTGVAGLDETQPILTTERQRDALRRCQDGLGEALNAVENGMTPDAVSVSVDAAMAALLELTGERVTDTVVDEVFARFCVGK